MCPLMTYNQLMTWNSRTNRPFNRSSAIIEMVA